MNEITVLLGAEIDLQAASETQPNERRADAFDLLVESAFHQLALFPRSGAAFHGSNFRRLVLSQTYYAFFYQVEGRRVIIHALLDLRQDPDAILRRLGL